MLDLYLSELRRFRNGTAIYALVSLAVLVVLGQLVELPGLPLEGQLMLLVLYAISGAALALVQFGTYRQPSRWIWLLHRPLHRGRILAALVLAALTIIALAVVLPLCLFLASQAHFTQHVVDGRSWLGAAWLALSAFNAWLLGACIMLHRTRWACAIAALPCVLTLHLATASTMLALIVACNLLLLGLLYTVFRPSRDIGHGTAATLGNALAMQAGFYLILLFAGTLLYQVGLMFVGAHPNNSRHVAPEGVIATQRLDARDTMLAGLSHSSDPRAAAWRAALSPRDVVDVRVAVRQFGVRDLITNRGPIVYGDGNALWTFSHDRMMYRGIHLRTQEDRGWLGTGGPGDSGRFDAQPMLVRDNRNETYLADMHNLYARNGADGSLRTLLHTEGREMVGGGIAQLGPRTLMLTNRRLVIFDEAAHSARAVPLPMGFPDLASVEAAQVGDGVLVSFVYGTRQVQGIVRSPQVVYLAGTDGRVTEVARRELAHDFPALFEHRGWWLSPVLYTLTELPGLFIDNGVVPDPGAGRFEALARARPAAVWIAAIAATLAAAAGALWWTRRTRMTPRERSAWCLACLLLGVPGLLSLVVLRPRAPVPAQAPAKALTA